MIYSLIYLELYKADLQSTLDYISDMLFSPDAANNLYAEVKAECNEIAKNPYIYSSYLGNVKLRANYRKAKVGNYYIFFEIDELMKNIKIKRFIYSRMDTGHILQVIYK